VGDQLLVASGRRSTSGGASSGAKSASKSRSSGGSSHAVSATRYKVRQGDTLFRIAKNLSTTVEKICDLNHLTAGDPLVPGRVLKIDR